MQMTMGVESFQKNIAKALGVGAMAVALAGPLPAMADGASSISTVYRTRGLYGNKILALQKAAETGDYSKLESSGNTFDLFIAGTNIGYNPAVKATRAQEKELAAAFKAAVAAKDSGKIKSTLGEFIKVADLKSEYKPNERGQTDSSGYAPTWGTESQYIYQR